VKSSKADIHRSFYKIPELKTEDIQRRSLTTFSGLIVFQKLFQKIKLNDSLKSCFAMDTSSIYPLSWITRWLIIHFLLGYRRLRDVDYYRFDPMVERVLGVTKLPDVSTISRQLKKVDDESIHSVRELNTDLVLNRISKEELQRVTFDFDGSVQSTKRNAEGSAVGFNKAHKGRRSYYPLFCTLSQTAQFFDMHHRPGNVHDSNGAEEFVKSCLYKAKVEAPSVAIETRMDGAFFQELLIDTLHSWNAEFTVSVPFYRFPELKKMVENRKRWKHKQNYSFFESDWSPGSWAQDFRIIIVRTEQVEQRKGPLQLDLFEPYDWDYS